MAAEGIVGHGGNTLVIHGREERQGGDFMKV